MAAGTMKKRADKIDLYKHEMQLLEKARSVGADSSLSREALLKEYLDLGHEYEKLLKQVIKITRIGDVSQRKLQTQRVLLEEKSNQLKELAEIKSRFFANISHEFRTPLTLIIGPLEQMLDNCFSAGERKTFTLVLRNAQRLLSLINQLLELAKFESGSVKLRAGLYNIIPFLKGITSCFELLARHNEIDLTFTAARDEIRLFFDPEKIEDVICNLLMNALKYTPHGGRITVSLREIPGTAVEISVKDTGPGIPREQTSAVFDRFYRMDRTVEEHKKGFGLGLAMVREYIALHKGEIRLNSGEGEGTEFVIRLLLGKDHLGHDEIIETTAPSSAENGEKSITSQYVSMLELEMEHREPDSADSPPGKEDKQEQEIVLVVEDSPDMRLYIRNALEPFYRVIEAENGCKGFEAAKEIIPDIIISDIIMPEMDGYRLCRELKQDLNTSHIPVVLLTAKAEESSIIEGLETGADDYITKPFSTKILVARIKNLIKLRRQLQEKIQRQFSMLPDEIPVSSIDQTFIKELEKLIESNLSNTRFGLDDLSENLRLSKATLYRKLCALTGESPKQFVQSFRLNRALQLLKANFGNVTDVAYEVGFSSSAYFTKCFKDKFHCLPSSFQDGHS